MNNVILTFGNIENEKRKFHNSEFDINNAEYSTMFVKLCLVFSIYIKINIQC